MHADPRVVSAPTGSPRPPTEGPQRRRSLAAAAVAVRAAARFDRPRRVPSMRNELGYFRKKQAKEELNKLSMLLDSGKAEVTRLEVQLEEAERKLVSAEAVAQEATAAEDHRRTPFDRFKKRARAIHDAMDDEAKNGVNAERRRREEQVFKDLEHFPRALQFRCAHFRTGPTRLSTG